MIPEIISAIANALMAIAAILGLGFTAYSVYQASKNIESATRPVITPYIELVNSDPGAYYFIIKNFGASSARITGFKTELRGFDDINNDMPILQQLSIHRTYDPFEKHCRHRISTRIQALYYTCLIRRRRNRRKRIQARI